SQQHITVADWRVVLGCPLDILPGCGPQELAQHRGFADLSAMKRVEDQAFRAVAEPDQEVPGKSEADTLPALRPRRVQVENPERYRQTFAAIDDPHQIAILQIVVSQFVAAVAMLQQDDLVERLRTGSEIASSARVPPDIPGERGEVLAVTAEIYARPLERGERERRLSDRQDRRVRGTELAQVAGALCGIEDLRQFAHRNYRNSQLLHLDWSGARC